MHDPSGVHPVDEGRQRCHDRGEFAELEGGPLREQPAEAPARQAIEHQGQRTRGRGRDVEQLHRMVTGRPGECFDLGGDGCVIHPRSVVLQRDARVGLALAVGAGKQDLGARSFTEPAHDPVAAELVHGSSVSADASSRGIQGPSVHCAATTVAVRSGRRLDA